MNPRHPPSSSCLNRDTTTRPDGRGIWGSRRSSLVVPNESALRLWDVPAYKLVHGPYISFVHPALPVVHTWTFLIHSRKG